MKLMTVAIVAALVVSVSAQPQAPDVAGRWNVSFETTQGSRPATLTITNEAGKLSGVLSSQQGEIPATVTLDGSAITIDTSFQGQNGTVRIIMSGKVDGNTMRGTVDVGGAGSAEWSASRATPPPAQGQGGSQEKPAPTMTGTWVFEVHHSAGTSTPTVTITQTGDKLGGKYASSYGQFELTGTIKGTEFSFSVEVGTEQKVRLVYTGSLDGDTVKGGVTMGEMGEGTFTGKRK